MRLLLAAILVLFTGVAFAQQMPHQQSGQPADPVVTAYQLGIQTGQQLAAVVATTNEKLRWWEDCVKDAGCVAWINGTTAPVASK